MSVNIKIYSNKNPVNKIDKTLTAPISNLNGNFIEPVNIINPSFKISEDFSKLANCNYCYIPSFGKRYYFIDSIDIIQDGIYKINCSIDVLKTYADSIKNHSAIISKVGEEYENNYINDGTFISEERTITKPFYFMKNGEKAKIFEGGDLDEDWVYILTCYGGEDFDVS